VILNLEVISPSMTGASRHTFHEDGGTIGRENDNSWVLPHSKVSGIHATITCRHGVFYIEDRSRNGVFLNSPKDRLERGRAQPLKSGDRILIGPYEIRVAISRDQHDRAAPMPAAASGAGLPPPGFNAADPFDVDDAFAPQPASRSPLQPFDADVPHEQLDPLELLNLVSKAPPQRNAPRARDLDRGSLLDEHFTPPAVVQETPPAPAAPVSATSIPEGYDPLAPDDVPLMPPAPRPSPPPPPIEPRRPYRREARSEPPPVEEPVESPLPVQGSAPVRQRPAEAAPHAASGAVDFGAVLAGAGLDASSITPEIAREFGQILRVVVSGVMDVMRSRQQIKDEFRMQGTRVRSVDNNPLKFSANIEDALHNLLMKRNPAYMSPVDAFEDAFADLRNHQIAMLAGMRTAFEAMLAEFDPDQLQQEFDRQLAKGLVPAKLRYWELYRERQQQIVKDPEAAFRRLFGDEFARSYEDQLKALKARERPSPATGSKAPKPSES
jgi:type VI secretion system FHA domain protein